MRRVQSFVIYVIIVLSVFSTVAEEAYHQGMIFYSHPSQVQELFASKDVFIIHDFKKYLSVIVKESVVPLLEKRGLSVTITRKNLSQSHRASFNTKDRGRFGYYPTLSEVDTILDGLTKRHPNIVKRGVLTPSTIQAREIYYAKISNSPSADNKKPEALITGGQHACEVIGPACVRLDMYHLCQNYGKDPEITWLVDNRQIYFVPVMNPDTYEYMQKGESLRKNRRDHRGVSARNDGVDLNRNYPYKWGYDNVNSSPDSSKMNYRGYYPVSEPETKAMVDFINNHKFRTWQNHHSANDVLVIPFGYNYRVRLPRADSVKYYTMCEEQQACYGRFKKWGPSYISYNGWSLNGGTEDWGWSDSSAYRLYCVITELGASMWESDRNAKVTAEKMLEADMYMIKCAGFYPVLKGITLKDDVLGNNDGKLNPGETVTLSATIENKSVVDTTPDVKGVLSSSYSHIEMKDSNANYGDVQWLTAFKNPTTDQFEFKCSNQANEGDWAKFDLKLKWTMHSVSFEKSLACSLQVGRLVGLIKNYRLQDLHGGLSIVQSPDRQSVRIKLRISKENLVSGFSEKLKVGVFNAAGREVARLDRMVRNTSTVIDWTMVDKRGYKIPQGLYFVRVSLGSFSAVERLIML